MFSVLNNDRFNYVVARVKCESDWNAIDIFLVDRFFGHGGGPLERQKNWCITSDFYEKSESSLHKRLKFVTEVLKINLENAD